MASIIYSFSRFSGKRFLVQSLDKLFGEVFKINSSDPESILSRQHIEVIHEICKVERLIKINATPKD